MKKPYLIIFFLTMGIDSFCQDSIKILYFEMDFGINYLLTKNAQTAHNIGFGLSLKRIWSPEKRINFVSGIFFEKTRYFIEYGHCSHFCYLKDMQYNVYSFLIPLLLRFSSGNAYKIYFETGPSFEIIPVNYGKGVEVTYFPMDVERESVISGNFEREITDVGVNLGINFLLPINNYNVVFSSSYHNSFQTFLGKTPKISREFITIKTGFFFNLRHKRNSNVLTP